MNDRVSDQIDSQPANRLYILAHRIRPEKFTPIINIMMLNHRRSSVESDVSSSSIALEDPRDHLKRSESSNTAATFEESERSLECPPSKPACPSSVVFRKRYQPRHRCPQMNGSLTGIIRPSRYSQEADLPLDDSEASAATVESSQSAHKLLSTVMKSFRTSRHRCGHSMAVSRPYPGFGRAKHNSWGVFFCPQMEVYVFEDGVL